MLKVLKNLKKSAVSVIIIVTLLCVQAWADLTLPDYTSRIVNTGIQAGGIENIAPEAIRKSQMDLLLLFTKENQTILNSYTLLSRENLETSEYEKQVKKYPELANQDIYVSKKLTKEEQENLNNIVAKPLMEVSILTNEETASKIKKEMLQNMPDEQKTIIDNMSFIQMLQNMPEQQKNEVLDKMSQEIDEKFGNMVDQVAITVTKQEYKELGMNTDDIQNRYILLVGIQMLGIALISMSTAITIMFLSSKVAAKLGKTLRDKVFKKVLSFSRRRI